VVKQAANTYLTYRLPGQQTWTRLYKIGGMTEPRTLLKRDESYAIHLLIHIAGNPGISTADLAERLQLPPAFTAKVVRRLVNAKMIRSQMGRGGGLSILIDLDETSMLDVIEAVSGPLVLDTCQTKPVCATQQLSGFCALKMGWFAGTEGIRQVLAGLKLGAMAQQPPAVGGATPS